LWSIWTSESIGQWVTIWDFAWRGIPSHGSVVPIVPIAVAGAVFLAAIFFGRESSVEKQLSIFGRVKVARSTIETFLLLAVLLPIGLPQVYSLFGANVANVVVSLKSGGLSRADAAAMERGYYEGLTNVNRFNSQLWEVYMNRPAGWLNATDSGLTRLRDDFLRTELAKGFRSETQHGSIQTNSWGMRDQDYPAQPPAGSIRAVLLGYSTVFGWGVDQDQTFEAVLERRINERLAGSSVSFELLNLSVPGYRPPQQVTALDESLRFGSRIAFYTAAGREQWNTINFLADILMDGVPIPYPELESKIAAAGVLPGMDRPTILRLLRQHEEQLLSWVYDSLAQRCVENGMRPVWIYLPPLYPTRGEPEEYARARQLAEAAGFEIIDLSDIFEGEDVDSLSLADWDRHPNAKAHKLIADRLYSAIESRSAAFDLPPM
jgi:hypothetical protein